MSANTEDDFMEEVKNLEKKAIKGGCCTQTEFEALLRTLKKPDN